MTVMRLLLAAAAVAMGAFLASEGAREPAPPVVEEMNREPPPSPAPASETRSILGVGAPGRRAPRLRDTDRGVPSGTVLELSTTTPRADPVRPRLRPADQSR